jgi:hypothetical protein
VGQKVLAQTPFKIIQGYKKTLDERSARSAGIWHNIKSSFVYPRNTFKNITDRAETDCITALISVRGNNIAVDFIGTDRKGKVSPKNEKWKDRKTEHVNFKRQFDTPGGGRQYPYQLQNFTLSVVIPYHEIETLLRETGNPPKVALYLGIEPAKAKTNKNVSFEHVTVCLIGADNSGNPVSAHTRAINPVDGRQTWPIDSFVFVEQMDGSIELSWPAETSARK